ncbi:response regulator [Novosphingobium sp. 9U]|uniref:response regulator n=1 Tax=Novosphingobium sp. 9U TaxID=2653158 RepID=UPI0013589AC3|nr:response regulator [Novosphingobium sp. 9U]
METPADSALSGLRILIVEDDPLIADVLAEYVESAGGLVVGPFASMVGALQGMTQLDAIDAAVLDIGLGGEDSYPLAEALQTTGIPFIFSTGTERLHLPERFATAGHLLKPYRRAELIAELARLTQP